MEKINWAFPPKGTGNEQGYTNGGIESFKGKKLIENLAREICQNSLDAYNPQLSEADGKRKPVRVRFDLRIVDRESHVMFKEYRECIDSCKDNWHDRMDARLERFIKGAEEMLERESIPVLVASDYNTTGLTGVNAEEDEDSAWRALAHADGTSVAKSSDSAGSYGIGKNAPFACTALSMVFYNTLAIDGGSAFQGVARLATIKQNGRKTQGVGHYLWTDNEKPDFSKPISSGDDCSFCREFCRTEYGSDIIIVGFNEEDNWVEKMSIAITANFFDAIHRGLLEVSIQNEIINASSLPDVIDRYFKDADTVERRVVYEWYRALTEPENNEPIFLSILEDEDVQVYIRYEDGFKNRVAFFRANGMKTRTTRPGSFQPYSAVVEVKRTAINELLRETEPVQHDRWDYKLITDDVNKKRKAKECIEKIDNEIKEILKVRNEKLGEMSQDSGEGDYLPDEEDGNNTQQGEDILRVRQKLGERRTISDPSSEQSITRASTGKGKKVKGHTQGGKGHRKTKKRRTFVSGTGDTTGLKSSNTGTPASAIKLNMKKAYVVNEKLGLYKVLIRSDRDCQNLRLSFAAVGEDHTEDSLLVQSYTINNKTKKQNNSHDIGPISLSANMLTEVFVTFETKEKMMLNISAVEVI